MRLENKTMTFAYRWRGRDGSFNSVTTYTTDPVEAQAIARRLGWPGHKGAWMDYLRADLRALWDRLTARRP